MRRDAPGADEPARVLLVEDDSRAAGLIGGLLRAAWGEGLVLAHAARLRDGIQELLDRGASCVLLDLTGPGSDVLAAVEQIRNAAPEVAIVVLADEPDEARSLGVMAAGAQDYLLKRELSLSALRRTLRFAIERKRLEVRLVHQALHDPLTGLPNRALFLDRLGVALDRARRTGAPVAVLFVDVDGFKEVNDTMGHSGGDRLLAGLAGRLREMLRPMDTIGRFGGDEFTLLFEDLASEREVALIADRVSRAASGPIQLEQGEVAVTVSIGISLVTDPSTPPETVIRDADAAMYRAKAAGGARYELYDEISHERAGEQRALESALRQVVDRSELRVHYQPKISLNGQIRVTGFEALVRWQHPERGLIAPAEFLPLAEELGIVAPIGAFVLEQALHQLERWQHTSPELTVSVNLSAQELGDHTLPPALAAAIEQTSVSPDALYLEVSVSSIALDSEPAVHALEALRSTGVRIAIDDYGTGPSPLRNLGSLPVDVVKIDRSLVGELGSDAEGSQAVRAVVDLAHSLGLAVVAEGVETDAQLAELRALGCEAAQGYLFSPAVPGEEAGALLTAH